MIRPGLISCLLLALALAPAGATLASADGSNRGSMTGGHRYTTPD